MCKLAKLAKLIEFKFIFVAYYDFHTETYRVSCNACLRWDSSCGCVSLLFAQCFVPIYTHASQCNL